MSLTKSQKSLARKKLYVFLAGRSVHDLTPEELKIAQAIGKSISADTMGESHPLPKMKLADLTYEQYRQLIELGYRSLDIQKALGVSNGVLLNWKHQNFPSEVLKRMKKHSRKKVGGTVD